MKFTPEHIHQLLIEKITGTIETVDDLVIEQLLLDDVEVMLQWTTLQEQFKDATAHGFNLEGDAAISWQKIAPAFIDPTHKKQIVFLKIAAAAAILASLATGIYLFHYRKPVVKMSASSSTNITNRIALISDNGETVIVKDTGSTDFILGRAKFHTSNRTLTYIAPGSGRSTVQQWSTLSVPSVFDYKIVLADGTEVWMNSETTLRFPVTFYGKLREVYVKGEAYFKVAKNAGQPFIVHANETAIKVLGTSFNINTYDSGRVTTALVEGSIAATYNDRLIQLAPGFEAISTPSQKEFKVKAFDQSEVLSWMKGIYYFHNVPLKELSKILTRWYNVKVQFNNSSLQSKTFSGEIFKQQSIELFLDNIKLSIKINPDLKDGILTFR